MYKRISAEDCVLSVSSAYPDFFLPDLFSILTNMIAKNIIPIITITPCKCNMYLLLLYFLRGRRDVLCIRHLIITQVYTLSIQIIFLYSIC